jgi:cell wall-associated NlpC family hydrolase
MKTRTDVIETARKALGTKFTHQGRTLEFGLDCVGLLLWTAHQLELTKYDFRAYPREPTGELLPEIEKHLPRLASPRDAQAGDVLAMAFGSPMHIALVTARNGNRLTIIHAVPAQGVIEHDLDEVLWGHVYSAYKIPLEKWRY